MKPQTLVLPLLIVLAICPILQGQTPPWTADAGNTFIYNTNQGNVGIGTTTPDPAYKLSVDGKIRAKEITVEATWADFVFDDNYPLMPLHELEDFIQENKHLPEIPSEREVAEKGVQLGEMQAKFLQKIEELTLYVIALNIEGKELEGQLRKLQPQKQ